jgi:hypothetical protein
MISFSKHKNFGMQIFLFTCIYTPTPPRPITPKPGIRVTDFGRKLSVVGFVDIGVFSSKVGSPTYQDLVSGEASS